MVWDSPSAVRWSEAAEGFWDQAIALHEESYELYLKAQLFTNIMLV